MTKPDGLVLHGGGLDSPLPIDERSLQDVYAAVDGLIEKSLGDKDPSAAIAGGKALIEGVQLRGVALMRLLYKLHALWAQFGLVETFEDRVMDEWGFSKTTIQRYLAIWRAVFDNETVPRRLLPLLAERPVNTLERLVRPVNEDKLVEAQDWESIANAADDAEVYSIVQTLAGKSVRGRPAMSLLLYADGTLVAADADRRVTLGVLRIAAADLEDKLRAKGIDRIRRGCGVKDI